MASRLSIQKDAPAILAGVRKKTTPPGGMMGLGATFQPDPSERFVRTKRSENDIKRHTLHSHIYAKPDTYIGSVEKDVREEWILDYIEKKLKAAKVDLPEGMIRLFLEILSNAGDNADASRRLDPPVAAGNITVTMDREWVTIRSEGEPIPIAPDPAISTMEKCLTTVDCIFGELLTSTNYDNKVIQMGCGKNGYGAKLANIFSKKFRARVGDPKRGQEHISVWEENMTQHVLSQSTPGFVCQGLGDPTTGQQLYDPETKEPLYQWVKASGTPYTGPAFVEISFLLDFKRFGYEYYPDEAFGLYARYATDFGLTCKVPIIFNNVEIDVRSIRDYGRLFFSEEECKTALVHYEWGTADNEPPAAIAKLRGLAREKLLAQCPTSDCVPIVELCIFDTPDKAIVLSFVNGLMTRDGGVHVTEAYRLLSSEILDQINKTIEGRTKKGKKKADAKDTKVPHLTAGDVKPHVSMIINCRLPDPAYNSQSKVLLTRPKPKLTIPAAMLTGIGRWTLTERLYAALDAKMFKLEKKSDGKKRRHITLDKGEDANEAGGPRSAECILYLVEGKSASAYPKKRIVQTPGGKDLSGYYPLKGKPLNVTNAPKQQIAENEEINAVKQMMGFCEGMDYTDPVKRATLRYGFILGCMDADSDGKHIVALWMNLLGKKWASILKLGMFGFLVTPVIRYFTDKTYKTCVHRCYSPAEADEFDKKNPGHKYVRKYYKGLGTSRDRDITDDLNTAPIVICVYDDSAAASLDLAFHKDQADARKLWIKRWREVTGIEEVRPVGVGSILQHRNVTSIINKDLIDFTIDSLFRAINSYKDGLKKSHRQALYHVLEHWNYGHSRKDSMKVARIAAAAAERTHYAHGEKSLMDTIIGMAQDFVGTNNLPFFTKDGQFGTRHDGGADAADGRYSETCPEWWVKYAYFKELTDLVPRRTVESEEAEPLWIPCIVPMHIINGWLGVATGHSTYGPAHNVYKVIEWLSARCQGTTRPTALEPWYRYFQGTIEVKMPASIATLAPLEAAAPSSAERHPSGAQSVRSEKTSRLNVTNADAVAALTEERPSRLKITSCQAESPAAVGLGLQGSRLKIAGVEAVALPLQAALKEVLPLPSEFPEDDEEEEKEETGEEEVKVGMDAYATLASGKRVKGASMCTRGVFTITRTHTDGRADLIISELAVGQAILPYRKWVEGLLKEKLITDFRDSSTSTEIPTITICGFYNKKGINHQTLRLQRSYGMSNMTLLDDDGYPYQFKNTQDVMEAYYQNMIALFDVVIANRIKECEQEITDLNYRILFINAVLDAKIVVFRTKKAEIFRQMDEQKIPQKYLSTVKLHEFTQDELDAAANELKAAHIKMEGLKKLTPQAVWLDKLTTFYTALQNHKYA
ncbi:DNA topoisomerase 2 [uncultured virus]|nr:DNA topoisomerase 2 [uncultured virus]